MTILAYIRRAVESPTAEIVFILSLVGVGVVGCAITYGKLSLGEVSVDTGLIIWSAGMANIFMAIILSIIRRMGP